MTIQDDLLRSLGGLWSDSTRSGPSAGFFQVHGLDVPVARLTHIARSKAEAGRPKDRLFLATHKEMLADLIRRHEGP